MARKIQQVGQAAFMRSFFARHMKEFWPGAKKITFFFSKYMKFLSEESYTMKYQVDVMMRGGKIERKVVRGNRVPKPTFDLMRALYPYFTKRKLNVIARPLYYIDELGFILYEEYDGWVLREFDHQIDTLRQAIPSIAARLADIHNCQLRIGNLRTWKDEAEYFNLLQEKMRKYMPSAVKKFVSLKDKYLQALARIYDAEAAISIHGDFQASNIIFDLRTQAIGIIDLSSTSVFSPTNDVATFMTHTRAMECFIYPGSKVDGLEKLFLSNYLKHVNKNLVAKVKKQLPAFIARISLDIITTTAVFTEYNKSPHYKKIINTMFERAAVNLKKII